MWNNKKVSLIFPTYNEKDSIKDAIKDFEASGYLDEIIVVNNNAAEGTSEEVAKANSKITREVNESKQGYGNAIQRGFREAKGDLIIVSEPDGTFFGRDVVKLLSYSDEFDVVYGSRTSRQLIWKGANMGWFLRWGNFFVAKLMEVLFNTTNLTDVGCTMRLIKRSALKRIQKDFTIGREHFGPEMMILTFLRGLKVIQLPVNYTERIGKSSVTGSQWKAFKLGIIMIVLILKYRLSYFGRFHIPVIKRLFTSVHNKLYALFDKRLKLVNPLRIEFIYFVAIAHLAVFFYLTYIRWQAHTPTMDYHAYVQMFWNTVQGKLLVYNQGRAIQTPFFRLHFAPFLIWIAWVYKYFPHPLTLYFVFNVFIAASILPIFFVAKHALKSRFAAYMISFIYILYPPFVWSHMQGFAEEAFATPLLAFTFYFLYKKKKFMYVLFSFLTLSLRINMTMPIFMLGLYAFKTGRAKKEGLFMSLISVLWLVYIMKVITPIYALPDTGPYIFGYFAGYGDTLPEIVHTMLFDPKYTLSVVTGAKKIAYLKNLFLPLFLIPLLSPLLVLVNLPILVIGLLATNTRLSSTVAYYHSSITPFLFYALIFGLAKIKKRTVPAVTTFLLVGMLVYSIGVNYFTSAGANLPFSTYFNIRYYEPNFRDKQADIVLQNIAPQYSVGTHDLFVEHIAERRWYHDVYTFEGYLPGLIFIDPWKGNNERYFEDKSDWIRVLEAAYYHLYARADLIKLYNLDFSEGEADLSAFPENRFYTAVLKPGVIAQNYASGAGRDQPVDITNDVVFAQELNITGPNVSKIEFPLGKVEFPITNFRDQLTYYLKPPWGALKVQIVQNNGEGPFGKVLKESSVSYDETTYKTGLYSFDVSKVEFEPGQVYWLVLSIDKSEGKSYEKYNKFRIHTSAQDNPEPGSLTNTPDQDMKKQWKNSLGNTELLYKVYYRNGKNVDFYEEDKLNDGTFVFMGTPSEITEKVRRVYDKNSDYNLLIFLGVERSTE